LSIFPEIGVAGPSSTPDGDFRRALGQDLPEREVDPLEASCLLDVAYVDVSLYKFIADHSRTHHFKPRASR
jgi:hypothetical protein